MPLVFISYEICMVTMIPPMSLRMASRIVQQNRGVGARLLGCNAALAVKDASGGNGGGSGSGGWSSSRSGQQRLWSSATAASLVAGGGLLGVAAGTNNNEAWMDSGSSSSNSVLEGGKESVRSDSARWESVLEKCIPAVVSIKVGGVGLAVVLCCHPSIHPRAQTAAANRLACLLSSLRLKNAPPLHSQLFLGERDPGLRHKLAGRFTGNDVDQC
jgi:hypothetical protein